MQHRSKLLAILEPELDVTPEEIRVLLERGVQFIATDNIRRVLSPGRQGPLKLLFALRCQGAARDQAVTRRVQPLKLVTLAGDQPLKPTEVVDPLGLADDNCSIRCCVS